MAAPNIASLAFLAAPPPRAGQADPWQAHAPFLRWLTGAVQPRLLVDLGAEASGSLDLFRDSARHWKLATACVGLAEAAAAEERPGDAPAAGLLRAAGRLAPESVDLLHLRGDAGPRDLAALYAALRPALSARAVVAIHGIGAASDAGELWAALRLSAPHVQFDHGGGLGVAAVGAAPPDSVRRLADLPLGELQDVLGLFAGLVVRTSSPSAGETVLRAEIERLRQRAASLEAAHDGERARAERAERRVEEITGGGTWRLAEGLRHPKTLFRPRKTLRERLLEAAPPIAAAAAEPAAGEKGIHFAAEETKRRLRALCEDGLRAFLAGGGRLGLPFSAAPAVSVVVPAWNQAALTLACLRSLDAARGVGLEVVLVDNGSTDETARLIERLDGAVVVRNATNRGYLLAVNQGVAASRGERVLLLNNDAMLRPGSLEAAVETLDSDASIGAVGGPIVLPDGRLQEAGSIIWSDGSCAGYGRGQAPDLPEFQFRRDVDYCSAAFLLVRRDAWNRLKGFDPAYAPGYYEETDFCMRLRQAGLRVVYEPQAVVDHFEFGSSDARSWTELQARNAATFRSRHRAALATGHKASGSSPLGARARPGPERPVLVIDDAVPHPDQGSGFPRARQLVAALARSGRDVTVLPLQVPDDGRRAHDALPPTVEVMFGVGEGGLAPFLAARAGHYGAVIVSRPHNMAALGRALEAAPGAREGTLLVYDAEALFSTRELLKARLRGEAPSREEAERRIRAEVGLSGGADRIVAVSEREAAQFRAFGSAPVVVLPHLVEPQPTPRPWTRRGGLLFVGRLAEEDSPNVDSLRWFRREVMPILDREDAPDTLFVAGRTEALAGERWPRTRLLGAVADLWPLYDRCRLLIAPTRFAAGIPHKVHEAAAHGLPVVATPLLAEQLGWRHERELLVADRPEGFARAVLRLGEDGRLWERLRRAALDRVRSECSRPKFEAALEAALAPLEEKGQAGPASPARAPRRWISAIRAPNPAGS